MISVTVQTKKRIDVIDVTDAVLDALGDATGFAVIYLRHTTASLLIGAIDDGLRADITSVAAHVLAPLRPFAHIHDHPGTSMDGKANGESHVLSTLLGTQLCLPVTAGKLDLGKWQRLLLLEFDGPTARTVQIRIIAAEGTVAP